MKEIWKDVKFIDKNDESIDFTNLYQVSNLGRVKGVDRLCKGCEQGALRKVKKKYKESIRSNGYIEVSLYKNNKPYRISVHRLVAYVFIPNPNNKPCVEHINTIRSDNNIHNLRWCTYIENNNNPITKQKQCISNKLALTPQKRKAISKTLKGHFLTHKNPWAQEIIDVKTNQKFNSIKKAAEGINKDEEWLARRLRGEVKNGTSFQYVKRYVRIKSIKRKHHKGKVYDLTVEKKHSYNIDGLAVHNSVGGSFIAYLMGITQIDPMRFNLLFHRFISKDRQDYPDIDIDVEKRYRDKVVKYIKDTYGQNNTCGISTCMTMQSKAAIRDVGRVMEIPSKEINQLAGSIWKGVKDLDEFFEKSTEGKTFKKSYPKETNLMIKMEGQCRGAGRHAAAVVISKDDLTKTDKCVLVNRTKQIVCNWTMGDSEYVGLMKLDILGLSTLSVLTEAKELINRKENTRKFYCNPKTGHKIVLAEMERELDNKYQGYNEIEFDFNAIPLEDKKVFDIISNGQTSGLFQLSGYSVTEFCKKMKIHSFNDIIAAISLARPGPADSGMDSAYTDRKHGQDWQRKHDIYEEVTKDTYGICIYQEQIMAVISKVAGLDESTADKIRKIIAKKLDTKKLKPFWEMFRNGCKKMKTFSEQEAKDFWEELKQHASYSFNKSHAGAYALIGYWTAWLKVRYPKEFYAASLTFNEWNEKSRDSNKCKESLLKEIRMAGYKIMPPKRSKSDAVKWQFNDKKIYTPFIEINGIGENNASKCLIAPKKNRIRGFFSSQVSCNVQNNTKLDKILQEMMVDDIEEIPSRKILNKYLPNINLKRSKQERYPNLMSLCGLSSLDSELDNWLTLNVSSRNLFRNFLQRKRFRLEKPVYQCNRCELRQRSSKPILSSTGLNNVVILFEHPETDNPRQDKIGTSEKAKLIFDELAKHGYKRRFFHVTSCCRCPVLSPSSVEIDECYHWLAKEIEQIECRLILGIGNKSICSLTGRNDNKIEDISGTTEWIENLSSWVCWCDEKNIAKSIENFVKILKKIV